MAKFVWFGGPAADRAGMEVAGVVATQFEATVKQKYRPGRGRDTGALQNSISAQKDSKCWIVSTPIYYAPFVEFGSSGGGTPPPGQSQFRDTAQELAGRFKEVSY